MGVEMVGGSNVVDDGDGRGGTVSVERVPKTRPGTDLSDPVRALRDEREDGFPDLRGDSGPPSKPSSRHHTFRQVVGVG